MASPRYRDDEFESLDSNEPDYEAIRDRRRGYGQEARAEREERSYERYVTGY